MNQQGTVTKIDGRKVSIRFKPLGCCGGSEGGGCHCSNTQKDVEFSALNAHSLPLKTGDYVDISNPTGAIWGGVFRLVVLPGALLTLGWSLGGLAFGLGGAALGILGSVIFPQSRDSGFPVVQRVIPVGDYRPLKD